MESHFELFEDDIPCGFTILWELGSPYCTAIDPSGSFVSGLFSTSEFSKGYQGWINEKGTD